MIRRVLSSPGADNQNFRTAIGQRNRVGQNVHTPSRQAIAHTAQIASPARGASRGIGRQHRTMGLLIRNEGTIRVPYDNPAHNLCGQGSERIRHRHQDSGPPRTIRHGLAFLGHRAINFGNAAGIERADIHVHLRIRKSGGQGFQDPLYVLCHVGGIRPFGNPVQEMGSIARRRRLNRVQPWYRELDTVDRPNRGGVSRAKIFA